jgi:hypothetical protein
VRRPGFSLEKNGFTRVKRGAFLCSRKPHAVTGLGSSVQQGKGAPVPIQPGDKRLNGTAACTRKAALHLRRETMATTQTLLPC